MWDQNFWWEFAKTDGWGWNFNFLVYSCSVRQFVSHSTLYLVFVFWLYLSSLLTSPSLSSQTPNSFVFGSAVEKFTLLEMKFSNWNRKAHEEASKGDDNYDDWRHSIARFDVLTPTSNYTRLNSISWVFQWK